MTKDEAPASPKDAALRLALQRAFQMGQNYWHHADHEFSSHHKRADTIKAGFDQLVEETIKQALAQPELEDYPTYDGYIKKALEQLNPPCKTGSQCTSKCEGCAETPVEIGVDVSSEGTHVVGMYVLPDAVRYVFYSQFHPNTSPPQRKPLTDEQKLALCKQFPDHLTFNAIKAIEAAHGIKE